MASPVIARLIRASSTPLDGFTTLWSWRVGSWISAWDFLCLHRLETVRRPVFQLAEGRVDREGPGLPCLPSGLRHRHSQAALCPASPSGPSHSCPFKGDSTLGLFLQCLDFRKFMYWTWGLWTPECVVLTLSLPPSLPDPRGSREGRAGKALEPVCPVQHTLRRNVAWTRCGQWV